MNRTTLTVVATLLALILLAGTSSAGFTAVPDLQDSEPLNVAVWLSETGSTDPVRRLDSEVTEAQIVVESDLRDRDPNRFRVEAVDASGNVVFRSTNLTLPTGSHTETVPIAGKDFFQSYVNRAEDVKDELAPVIDDAIVALEEERVKEPCTFDPENDNPRLRTNPTRVAERINLTQAPRELIASVVQQLLSFDSLDTGVQSDLNDVQAALDTIFTRGSSALDKLQVPDDAELCPEPLEYGIEIPNWEPDWDLVLADLNAMNTSATDVESGIDSVVAGVDLDADRSFPSTGVENRCNQNAVQLRVAGSGAISADFWWMVGTPSDPVTLASPEDPTTSGRLLARPIHIYSQDVDVEGAPHASVVETLVLDALCLPVPDATVQFSVPAGSIVTLDDPQQTTDSNGVAKATVNATDQLGETGMATVNASVGAATATTNLIVVGPPYRLALRLGGSEAQRVPNYGIESTVQVSTVVKDAHENDVADGTPVHFSIEPPSHSFIDSGQVTTAGGEASITLVFGSETGFFTITAEAGDASDSHPIQVVGNPEQIEVTAAPPVIQVNRISVDDRSSLLTVKVMDSEGRWAPDGTMVEFEFVDEEDANWAYFTLTPDPLGDFKTPTNEGTATTHLVGRSTHLQHPDQKLSYREVTVRVIAVYEVGGEVRGSVSDDITVVLRGESVFLPLIVR